VSDALPSPFGLPWRLCRREERDGLPEAHGAANQGDEGDIELTALDLLKVLQVQIAAFRGLLERPPFGFSKTTQLQTKGLRFTKVSRALLVQPRLSFVATRFLRHPPRRSELPRLRSISHVAKLC
jgi:hypothetical protein